MPPVDPVLLVPVKAFTDAKARLSGALTPAHRDALARWSAEQVLGAAQGMPAFIACDHPDVAEWAQQHGARVLWHPGVGLNAAITRSVVDLRTLGVEHVVIAHADLPRACRLAEVASAHTVTLVPDSRLDGTNVLSLPTALDFEFQYGVGSFRRHLAAALATGAAVSVRRDPLLSLDIDNPSDLTHPLVQEVLPSWLPTNLANQRPPSR
jgi:2-phospho-L-lactate guanylyltransferase